jgi:hypothetical protein
VSRVGHGLRRSRPIATSFTPSSVAGLALWLDASDASTFTFGSGTRVQQWRDKSGNARHFAQATTAAQPDRAGTQNSLTTVTFTASNTEFMSAGDTLDLDANDMSMFIAGRHGTATSQSFIAKALFGPEPQRWGFIREDASTIYGFYTDAASQLRKANATPQASWQTWGCIINRSGGAISTRRAGTQQAATGFTAESNVLNSPYLLLLGAYNSVGGGIPPAAGLYLDGQIGEVLIYTRTLSGAELTNVESYLRTKWGTP